MGTLRETQRTGATGALGAAIFTRGKLKPTLKWGATGAALGGGADIVRLRRRRREEAELEVIKLFGRKKKPLVKRPPLTGQRKEFFDHVARTGQPHPKDTELQQLVAMEKRYKSGDQLYRRETRVSPWRATEAIAGVTLAAAGASRLKMVGRGISMGTKLPGKRKLPFERAQSVRNAAQKGTNQVGPTLRRNDTMSGTMDLVPSPLRPAAATVGGMAMIGHARPVKREKYVPSNRRR